MKTCAIAFLLILLTTFTSTTHAQSTSGYIAMSRYLGGSGNDNSVRMLVDNGFIYAYGTTTSANYPVSNPAFGGSLGGQDIVITKMDLNGNVIYSRYLGTTATDGMGNTSQNSSQNFKIVNGEAYLMSFSFGTGFTGTVASGTNLSGTGDYVVTRLDASGNVVFSRYLGGNGSDNGNYGTIAVENGSVYVGGITNSSDFPATDGSILKGGSDGFVAKLNGTTGAIVYAKFLGGTSSELAMCNIDVENGMVYLGIDVPGSNGSNTFPSTDGTTMSGTDDYVFVKLDASGNVVYATYKGGTGAESGSVGFLKAQNGNLYAAIGASPGFPTTDGSIAKSGVIRGVLAIKLGATGATDYARYLATTASGTYALVSGSIDVLGGEMLISAYVTGDGYPVTNGSIFTGGGNDDAAFTRLNTDGSIAFSTYLGGSGIESGLGGVKYINGYYYYYSYTNSTNYPVTNSSSNLGGNDNVLTIMNGTGNIVYSTFIGGGGTEGISSGPDMFVSGSDVYIGGTSGSNNYPVTNGVNYAGGTNDFVITKISFCPSNYYTTNDTIRPKTQIGCRNGVGQMLRGQKIIVPGDSLPTIYRNGVASQQSLLNEGSYQWQISGSATGPFTDITGATLKDYQPVVGTVDLYYRRLTKTSSFCGGTTVHTSDTAAVLVNAFTAPVAVAGTDKITCPSSAVTLGGSPSATGGLAPYTYAWDFGAGTTANPSVAPAGTTIYTLTVTDANGCKAIDQVVVNTYAANAGPDVSNCGAASSVQIGGAPAAGVAGISYAWSPATNLTSATVAQPLSNTAITRVYTLTMTVNKSGGGTCATNDAVTVTPVAAPVTANFAGPDRTICSSSTASLGTTAESGFTYTWTPGNFLSSVSASTTTYNPGSLYFPPSPDPGYYTLTASKSGCSFTDQTVVNVIRAHAGQDGCGPRLLGGYGEDETDAPNLNETFTWTKISGPGNFVGPTNIPHPAVSASVGGATTYQLVVSLNGQTCTDQVVVGDCGGCSITINVVGDNGCANSALGHVGLQASGGDAAYTYSWSPAVGLSAYTGSTVYLTDNVARTYTVTRTSRYDASFTCSKSKDVNQANMNAPVFTAVKDTVCAGTALTVGQGAVAGYAYLWSGTGLSSTTASNPSYTATTSSVNFPVLVTDVATGCTTKDTAEITTRAVVADAGKDWNMCSAGVVQLGTPALPNYTYSWSPANANWQNGTSATSAQPELLTAINLTFTLTVTDQITGCISAADVVNITISSAPSIPNAPDVAVCKGTGVVIGSPAVNGLTYSWSPATGLSNPNIAQPTATPNSTTTYTCTASFNSGNGCAGATSDNVTVTVSDPSFTMAAASYCPSSGAVTLSGAPAGMTTYSWSPASQVSNATIQTPTTLNPPPSSSTTYSLTVTNSNGCTATSTKTINPTISAPNAGSNRTICLNTPTQLGTTDNVTGAGISYAWTGTNTALLSSTTAPMPTFTPTAAGTYTYTVTKTTTSPACSSTDVVTIIVNDFQLPALTAKVICGGSCVQIGTAAVAGANYAWSPAADLSAADIANPTSCAAASTIYTLVGTGINGCVDTAYVPVTVNTGTPPSVTMSDINSCFGTNTVQFAPSVTPAGTYNYVWSPNDGTVNNVYALNPTITNAGTGTKSYTLTATDPATGCASSKTANITVEVCTVSVSGNIFNDTNGLSDSKVNGTGTNVSGTLYVHLLDANGAVIATAPVNSDGTYTFSGITPGTYSAIVNINPAASTPGLPGNYRSTGEFLGSPTLAGNDGTVNGILTIIVVANSDVTNANFGIEEPPVAGGGVNDAANPGGTIQVTVPANTFTNTTASSDPSPGAVTGIIISSFPAGATTIVINGNSYTSASFPAAGVTVPADASGNPTQTITVDPSGTGATTVVISFKAVDAAGQQSSNTGTAIINFTTVLISGNVYDDANGLSDSPSGIVNGTGTNAGGLNAVLYDLTTGTVARVTAVAADGTYSMSATPGHSYSVEITTNSASIGSSTLPEVALPSNWALVGENIGALAGSDGTIDGTLLLGTVNAAVANANFGIDQKPAATTFSYVLNPVPTRGGTYPMDGSYRNMFPLDGDDPEQGSLGSGATFVITSLGNMDGNVLSYNGVQISGPATIANYNPALLTITFNQSGNSGFAFNYAVRDAAGVQSDPASYTVTWGLGVLAVKLVNFAAQQQGNKALPQWSTAEESGKEHFELQRSIDSRNWQTITKLPAKGNGKNSYSFTDNQPGPGSNYYRLLMDNEGIIAYSPIRKLDFAGKWEVKLSPNPAKAGNAVTLQSNSAISSIKLLDMQGRALQLINGNNTVAGTYRLTTASLAKGLYFVQVINTDGQVQVLKLVKE